jgi:FMN phosphatase YigB (HAD superfamily)
MPITTVVFDVGETLVDETRQWGLWADWMGVPRLTFFAAMGVVVDHRLHHRQVFELVRPGYDWQAEAERRREVGHAYVLESGDFYPDALPCLTDLRFHGYHIGISGNQPESIEDELRQVGVKADFIASSSSWGWRSRREPSSIVSSRRLAARRRRSPMSATGSTTTSCPPAPPA